jgi:hypothetical protein
MGQALSALTELADPVCSRQADRPNQMVFQAAHCLMLAMVFL